jgi:MoxR-like ATPase
MTTFVPARIDPAKAGTPTRGDTDVAASPAREIRQALDRTIARIGESVVGQPGLVRGMLIGLLCNGHVLIEGVPGLAKTTAVSALAAALGLHFRRLQFTPDLLPADIIGSEVYRPQEHRFEVQRGPVFANLVLVDEINRAPAKVQSALLEAMQERQVSIAGQTLPLPRPFMVLATQNPIDQQGTYALPEAQMDRFLLKLLVRYPGTSAEREILSRSLGTDAFSAVSAHNSVALENQQTNRSAAEKLSVPLPAKEGETSRIGEGKPGIIEPTLSRAEIEAAQASLILVRVSDLLQQYIIELISATRDPYRFGSEVGDLIRFGVSPRGTIALAQAARAAAFLSDRDYATPDDVHQVLYDALRHRVILSYEALAEEKSADEVLREVVQRVPVP